MLFIAQQIFSPSQIPSFAQRNFCHFKNNAPKVHAAFKSPTIVLEENKHFTEDAQVSPPKQTELSPFVKAEHAVVLFKHKYGSYLFSHQYF